MAPRPSNPVNLTAAAEQMPWTDARKSVGVSGPSEAFALDVCALAPADITQQNDGSRETVYVVTAGFGVLRYKIGEMECTAGDVLFVPKGCPHRFERLDGEIEIWRISPTSP